MEVKLNDEQLNKALEAAVLVAIGETGREEIIKQAIAHLVKQEPGSAYNRTPISPLKRIINSAAANIAQAILTKKFAEDEAFIAGIEALYADAVKKMLDVENREKLVEKLAGAMARAFEAR